MKSEGAMADQATLLLLPSTMLTQTIRRTITDEEEAVATDDLFTVDRGFAYEEPRIGAPARPPLP